MKNLKYFIKILFLFIFLFFIFGGIIFIYEYIVNQKLNGNCFHKNIFTETKYKDKFLFSSSFKDYTYICSFSLEEQTKNLDKFENIDEEFYKNIRIDFSFKKLDSFIEDDWYKKHREKLKQIKNDIEKFKELEDTKYYLYYLNSRDSVLNIYNPTENKGYSIVITI